ncbi:hypothetical protein KEJ37_01385 [Candidatus Bathyarchaeota archaeon]|nr:hypothetical protein [Candidatus Bathyarchaeota archaeon]
MPENTKKIKKIREKKAEKPLLNKKLLVISITLAAIIILGAIIYQFFWRASESEVRFSLKAAIIDQLSEDLYNKAFVDNVTKILNDFGFKVTYYNHTRTKVEFFKGLAKGNYGIIILRTHAALRKDGSAVDFFTSEHYVSTNYEELQNKGLLVKGELNISGIIKEYFAFTSDFVKELEGTFPKSIVIAMGCQTLNLTAGQSMAKAFCDTKGAKVYIGWSSWVLIEHSDKETIKLIHGLLHENKAIGKAVEEAGVYGKARLSFYPESAGNLKISDLIAEAELSSSSLKGFYTTEIFSVRCFSSLATIMYNWFRRLSPIKFAIFNFLTSSASVASSRTSFIHFSKSPRYR